MLSYLSSLLYSGIAPWPFLSFTTWPSFKSVDQLFVEFASVWICLVFPHGLAEVMHSWQELTIEIACPSQCIV